MGFKRLLLISFLILSGLAVADLKTDIEDGKVRVSDYDLKCEQLTYNPFKNIYKLPVFPQEFGVTLNRKSKLEVAKEFQLITCRDIEVISNVIANVNTMAKAANLDIPHNLSISMVKEDDNAFMAGSVFTMLPRNIVYAGITKNPSVTNPVWAHEYGHSIFALGLVKLNPAWKSGLELLNNVVLTTVEFGKLSLQQTDIAIQMEKIKDGKELLQLKQKMENLEIQRAQLETRLVEYMKQMESSEYNQLTKLLSPHNEFFADVVAVLNANNGQAVKDAFFRTKEWQSEEGKKDLLFIGLRDFTNRNNEISKFKKIFEDKTSNPDLIEAASEAHNSLAAARYFLWANYIKGEISLQKKAMILNQVLKSIYNIAQDIKAVCLPVFDSSSCEDKLSPVQMNIDLIQELENNLRYN